MSRERKPEVDFLFLLTGFDTNASVTEGVNRFADRRIWPFFTPRIADFSDKLSGFADLKSTVDRGLAKKLGSDSGLCMSRSSDYGSGHYFSVCLVRYFGVLPTSLFSVPSF